MIQSSTPTQGLQMNREDVAKWVVVSVLVLIGLVALIVTRQMIAPIDSFVTEQVCSGHGDKLSRPVIDHERSNRFGLVGRSHGWCLYGPVGVEGTEVANEVELADDELADDELAVDAAAVPLAGSTIDESANVQLSIEEIEPDGLYRTIKVMGIVLQLGAASVAVRALGDPLLDRFVRPRR